MLPKPRLKFSASETPAGSLVVYLSGSHVKRSELYSLFGHFEAFDAPNGGVEIYPFGLFAHLWKGHESLGVSSQVKAARPRAQKLLLAEIIAKGFDASETIYFKVPVLASSREHVELFDFISGICPAATIQQDVKVKRSSTEDELEFYVSWVAGGSKPPQSFEAFRRIYSYHQITLACLEAIVLAHSQAGNAAEASAVQAFLNFCPQAARAARSRGYRPPKITEITDPSVRMEEIEAALFSAPGVDVDIYGQPLDVVFPVRTQISQSMRVVDNRPIVKKEATTTLHEPQENPQAEWHAMEGHEFERALARLLIRHGWNVKVTQRSGDHGVDLEGSDEKGLSVAIQCKRWKDKAGERDIREFRGSTVNKYRRKIFWCTGWFTRPAQDFARKHGIELKGLRDIKQLETL